MTNIVVDVEADGPVPGLYSMVSFGAVIVEPGLTRSFYGQLRPISDVWVPGALAVSGHTREETETFMDPGEVMSNFALWIATQAPVKPHFWSDNNGFDWQFINYYFHCFTEKNPFGHSSQNINSLYKGIVKNSRRNFKHLRKTKHSHHPVDDARGNAEAMIAMEEQGMKF